MKLEELNELDEYLERRGGCFDDDLGPCPDCGEEDCDGECNNDSSATDSD